MGLSADKTLIQYTSPNPALQGVSISFKTPGATSQSADQLVAAQISALSPPATGVTPAPNATIGGTNWSSAVALYAPAGVATQIQVFATVYQNKAYIIELQAPQASFPTMNSQYFSTITTTYQFVPAGQ